MAFNNSHKNNFPQNIHIADGRIQEDIYLGTMESFAKMVYSLFKKSFILLYKQPTKKLM